MSLFAGGVCWAGPHSRAGSVSNRLHKKFALPMTPSDLPQCLPDIIEEGLSVVFCGINPGVLAASTGRHFAGRGNRFWRVVHLAGFTPEQLHPDNDRSILQYGCGLTTAVARPTSRADELSREEFKAVADQFEQKIARYAPRYVAFLGKMALSEMSGRRDIQWGPQTVDRRIKLTHFR